MTDRKKLLFQMSGSIACFKAAALLSELVKTKKFDIKVVISPSVLNFLGLSTLEGLVGNEVYQSEYGPGHNMDHIHLDRWADCLLLCPASASRLNKFRAGISDDLLGTLFLAHDFKKPYLIVPAMNTAMYEHPSTKESISYLKQIGIKVLDTAEGSLACGEEGAGRMLEPELIKEELFRIFT